MVGWGNFYAEKGKHSLPSNVPDGHSEDEGKEVWRRVRFCMGWNKRWKNVSARSLLVSVREKPNPPGSG